MKKISFFMALLVMVMTTFTSCKEDTQPRLEKPTEFVLNVPAMSENLYVLSPENGIELTVSQADYGLGVVANYQVEISYDKTTWQTVEGTFTNAVINVPGEQFSLAMCTLSGYDSEATFDDTPRPVFVRVHSFINNATSVDAEGNEVNYSSIRSNVIELKQVQPYFAVKLPDKIWIVGQCQGWGMGPEGRDIEMTLVETEPESLIYQGTFYINAGEFQFRFYDKPGDDGNWSWDSYSIGAQDEDNPVEITMDENGLYEGKCFRGGNGDGKGKGSWQISTWEGGNVSMTVDLSNNKVAFQVVE